MNSSIHFSNYSLIFRSWHYHFRYLISKNLAPLNVKWSISQVPELGYIYVCTVRQYWSNSLYQGRYTRKSLWLRLASVDQCSPQYNYKNYLWGDVCCSLYVYFNVKCLYSVYCFLVTILFMDFKPIKYFWFLISDFCTCTNNSFGFFSSL